MWWQLRLDAVLLFLLIYVNVCLGRQHFIWGNYSVGCSLWKWIVSFSQCQPNTRWMCCKKANKSTEEKGNASGIFPKIVYLLCTTFLCTLAFYLHICNDFNVNFRCALDWCHWQINMLTLLSIFARSVCLHYCWHIFAWKCDCFIQSER